MTESADTAALYFPAVRTDPLSYLQTELNTLKDQGIYRSLRELSGEQAARSTFDGRSVVNLSSNNYLGLTTHPKLRKKAIEAIEQFGVGSGAVRTIAGTMEIHMELERRLAAFKKTEAVVVFQSGFTANAGTVSSILSKEDIVISDELNHASIIDGCRLSRAAIKVFPHKDTDAARKILQDLPAGPRKLLITDGVFSMDGDLGALPSLCALAEEYGCIMMVDDAHASGVFGANGRGTIDHFGMHGRVDIQVGHALEGDRLARRLRRRIARADRLPLSPRAAVPVLDVASAVGGGELHRGARRAAGRAGADRPAVGEHAVLPGGTASARIQHRAERKPHHAGDRRRRRARDGALGSAVPERRVRAWASRFRPSRRTRRACGRSSRRRIRARICSSRWTCSVRSDGSWRSSDYLKEITGRTLTDALTSSSLWTRSDRPRAPVEFFEVYTKDLTASDLQRLFTRDAREAYAFFSRGVDRTGVDRLPWYRRLAVDIKLFFLAFSMRLSPARRMIFGVAFSPSSPDRLLQHVGWPSPDGDRRGLFLLLIAFGLLNLLIVLEVADRLSLKHDLNVARDIQLAMLPHGTYRAPGLEVHGQTRPANTVGGDFYDLLPLPDGRVLVALGDVAGKGSPAALLMALLLAILRTLVDLGLDLATLMARLNGQVRPARAVVALHHAVPGAVRSRTRAC